MRSILSTIRATEDTPAENIAECADALLQTHAFRTESAREHAISRIAYDSALLTSEKGKNTK